MIFLAACVLVVAIWFIPDHIVDELGAIRLKRLYPLPLVRRGEKAMLWVQTGQGCWPDYKFYGDLLRELARLSKFYGATPKASLERVKRPLQQDVRFESKLWDNRKNALMQFLVMAFMTWTFIFVSRTVLERTLFDFALVLVLLLQITGAFAFIMLEKVLAKRKLADFEIAFCGIIQLQALSALPLSVKEKIERSGINKFTGGVFKNAAIERVRQNLIEVLRGWKDEGRAIDCALADFADDLRFLQESACEHLIRTSVGLKFFVAAMFFLPAYLIDLITLIQSFSELNS